MQYNLCFERFINPDRFSVFRIDTVVSNYSKEIFINGCLKLIEENSGEKLDFDNIDLFDSKTYELIAKRCAAYDKLKPTCFEELVAMRSLFGDHLDEYRSKYIEFKNKSAEDIEYYHPDFKSILSETSGSLVYHEG